MMRAWSTCAARTYPFRDIRLLSFNSADLYCLILDHKRPWSHGDSWNKHKECDHMVLFYVIGCNCVTWHGSFCEPSMLETDIWLGDNKFHISDARLKLTSLLELF